jgi:fumarate hydratase class II
MMPVAAYDLLQSIALLATSARNLAVQSVDGIVATDNGPALVERGLMITTALAPRIGYDAAAAIAKEAHASGRTIREVARERSGLSDDELAELLDPEAMTRPGLGTAAGG